MPQTADLGHLLKLLDDESPVVREAVRRELAAMRRELAERLEALGVDLTTEQERLIGEILAAAGHVDLEESWLSWRWLSSAEARIEEALSQISSFLGGWKAGRVRLSARLDALAERAREAECGGDARRLAGFLFGGRGNDALLRGNSRDYYSANNSNLHWVIEHGLGNPISLCCIFMLTGHRLGLHIEGCNFPGHFLARVQQAGQTWLVDCFNRGRFMLAEDVAKHHPAANPSVEEVIREPAAVETIIARTLRNLDDACAREGNLARRQVVRRLILKLMES